MRGNMQMVGIVGETKYKNLGGIYEEQIQFQKRVLRSYQRPYGQASGRVRKRCFAYAYEGKPFITKDEYLKGAFLYVKRELDVSKQNSINGKKGADKRAEMKRRGEVIGIVIESVMTSNTARKDAAGE